MGFALTAGLEWTASDSAGGGTSGALRKSTAGASAAATVVAVALERREFLASEPRGVRQKNKLNAMNAIKSAMIVAAIGPRRSTGVFLEDRIEGTVGRAAGTIKRWDCVTAAAS